MSEEWAHYAARKEVPTVINLILGGYSGATTDGRGFSAVAGTGPRGEVLAHIVQDRSGAALACPAVPAAVARPRTPLQKNPFMTHGAATNGALLGPHRPWDPV
jgi:hypothetical protein